MKLVVVVLLTTFFLPPLMLGGPAAATVWLDGCSFWRVAATYGFLGAAILGAYGVGLYEGRGG